MEDIAITKDTAMIAREEYEELLSDAEFLNYLHATGVENWKGYELAKEMMEENT